MRHMLLATLAFVMLVQDCSANKPKQPEGQTLQAQMTKQPYQRFVPYTSTGVSLNWALDTKTGQVCRTWDWSLEGQKVGVNGMLPIQMATPTCSDLYTRYPD